MELEMSTTKIDAEINGASKAMEDREWAHRLEKFGDNSSFSAAVYEFKSKSNCKRFLWGLMVVAAIAGFCYITAENIRDLIRDPISTSITENRETMLEFPAVTICSLSFLNTTKLDELSLQVRQSLPSNDYSLTNELDQLFNLAQAGDIPNCINTAENIASSSGFTGGFSRLITETAGNSFSDLLIECSFRGIKCTDANFEPIETVSGVCYTFNHPNSGETRNVSGTGVRQGLRLQLKNGNQLFSLNDNYGYNVIVHNRDEPPRPESEGIVVGLTSNLYIGMRQQTSTDKTRFYSGQDCIRESTAPTNELRFPGYDSYSQSLCLNECFYSSLADKCQCVEEKFYELPSGSRYANTRTCNAVDLCCEVDAFESFEDNCDCPLKCESVGRTLTASSATHAFDDRVGINVYYETLVTESRETTDSYTPWSLVSDIGGNTGLFLGFTLLTAGEVLLLVLALCTDCCCSSCKKKMKKRAPWCWAADAC